MAHTDACKFQVCQFVRKCVDNGMSVSAATQEAERESDGIPAETIRYWWKQAAKEIDEQLVNSHQSAETPVSSGQTGNLKNLEKSTRQTHGGARSGSGRKKKYEDQVEDVCSRLSDAMDFATIAISHLERINPKDPNRKAALDKVYKWIEKNK